MAKVVVMASGGGSNFQAIAEAIRQTPHEIAGLICDRKEAGCFSRGEALNITSKYIPYYRLTQQEAEEKILSAFIAWQGDILVLAGFMRLLSASFIQSLPARIVNIHPSLLPKYPGTKGIEESFRSDDAEMGITIHYVDKGMDTGPVILQKKIPRIQNESLEDFETRIHRLEHRFYPETVLNLLSALG